MRILQCIILSGISLLFYNLFVAIVQKPNRCGIINERCIFSYFLLLISYMKFNQTGSAWTYEGFYKNIFSYYVDLVIMNEKFNINCQSF